MRGVGGSGDGLHHGNGFIQQGQRRANAHTQTCTVMTYNYTCIIQVQAQVDMCSIKNTCTGFLLGGGRGGGVICPPLKTVCPPLDLVVYL